MMESDWACTVGGRWIQWKQQLQSVIPYAICSISSVQCNSTTNYCLKMLRVELTPFAHSLSSEWVLQSWIAFECFCFYCANQLFLSKGTPCLSLSLCGLESGFQLGSDLTHKSADSLEKLLETCETRTARWVNIKLYDTFKIWYAFRANHFVFLSRHIFTEWLKASVIMSHLKVIVEQQIVASQQETECTYPDFECWHGLTSTRVITGV